MTVEITYDKPSPIIEIKAECKEIWGDIIVAARLPNGDANITLYAHGRSNVVVLSNDDIITFAKALIEMVGGTEAASDE